MRLVEALSGLAAALAETKRADPPADPSPEESEAGELLEPEVSLPHAEGLAAAIAALDAPVDALPHPLDLPYAEPEDEGALEEMPITAQDEPDPIVAVVEQDGTILATQPGGEPMRDAVDALPIPFHPEGARPPDTGEEAVGARVPSGQDEPSSVLHVPPVVTEMPTFESVAVMRTRVRAGDIAGAVGEMRAALTAAGTDHDRLHALLPDLRALADATPHRPDSRRLLGDAYSRLGLYAQAQGQYRQALLVRVAGRHPNG
jgi:hypothetical protein